MGKWLKKSKRNRKTEFTAWVQENCEKITRNAMSQDDINAAYKKELECCEYFHYTNYDIVEDEEFIWRAVPKNVPEDPIIIKDWEHFKSLNLDNGDIYFDVDVEMGNANVKSHKDPSFHAYLSTHTFYESNYKHSTERLQMWGFKVALESWG